MSDLHDHDERPSQYRAECPACGSDADGGRRMHSHLRERHLRESELDEWDSDETYVQCNVCGHIKQFH